MKSKKIIHFITYKYRAKVSNLEKKNFIKFVFLDINLYFCRKFYNRI